MRNTLHINFSAMRNDQHFQYFLEFGNIIVEFDPELLKVLVEFELFKQQFEREDEALRKIAKSPFTAKIKLADSQRNDYFRGLVETCKIATRRHFNEAAKMAATDLMIVFDTYGNLARKPQSEKTSAILNLVSELRDKHNKLVIDAGLEEWVDELASCNSWCYQLIQDRWNEIAEQTPMITMKQARANVEAAYDALMEMLMAQRTVSKDPIYDRFLRRLQAVVDTFRQAIAVRSSKGGNDEGGNEIEVIE